MPNRVRPLEQRHELYFDLGPATRLVPVDELRPTEPPASQPRSVERAEALMRDAAAGRLDRRGPIRVKRVGEREYLILDGNATYGVAVRHSWRTLPVVIEDES